MRAAVRFLSLEPLLGPLLSLNLEGIDWVIVGGESGRGYRPLDLDPASGRAQLRALAVMESGRFWPEAPAGQIVEFVHRT